MEKNTRISGDSLAPKLTLIPLFYIIVANMIGSGIFTTSGFIIRDVQNPLAMLLCWLIGGLLALTGALCYAELGAMFPEAGGDYVFLRESFGKRIAFLSGWISLWVGFSAPIAAVAIAFGNYVNGVLPAEMQNSQMPNMLAVRVIIFFTWVHVMGLLFGTRMLNFITLAKIILILSFILFGLTSGKGSFGHFNVPLHYSHIFSENFATSLIFVSFAYSGWNACVYLGSEVKNAGRNVPVSIISATLFVIGIYLLLNVVYIYAIQPKEMYGIVEIGSLTAVHLFGDKIGSLFGLLIAFCLLSALSSMILIGPRVYYAMAQDQVFFKIFKNLNQRHHVPSYAIILQGIISIAFVLTSTFYTLLMYVGFVLAVSSSLTVLGMMILRTKYPNRQRPYKTWGYPFTALLFIIGNVWIIIFSIRSNLTASLWGVVTVGVGWIIYECFDGRVKKHRLI